MSDIRSAGVDQPRRGWKNWYLIPIGCLGLIALIAALVFFVFAVTRPVVDAGDSFMTALKAGDNTAAYALASPSLQRELGSAENLGKMAGTYRPSTWSWSGRHIENGTGRVEGTVTFADGRSGHVRIVLLQSGGGWKVSAFQLNPD
jgi:hypothetical protein